MANGDGHWWEYIWEFGKWIAIGLASLASSAALWFTRHYKRDRGRLEEAYRYVRILKKHKAISKLNAHDQAVLELDKKLADLAHASDRLDDQLRTIGNVATSLQATVSTLTALTETRGKEHHQLRDLLQPMVTRLTVLEMKAGIGNHGSHGE